MPRPDLRGRTILVTRPKHQALKLSALIEEAGGRAVLFPLLLIEGPRDVEAALQQLQKLLSYDLLIFISPNAVERGVRLLQHHHIELPSAVKLACVGKGTARAMEQQLGCGPDICPPQRFDSEGLLESAELQQVDGQRILIIRGEGGREHLAQSLRARGAEVNYAEVYRRSRPDYSPEQIEKLLLQRPDIMLISSSEALENLLELTPQELHPAVQALPMLVLNPRMGERAAELGFHQAPIIPHTIGDQGIMEALSEWARNTTLPTGTIP